MYEAGLISVAAALVLLLKVPRHILRKILWLDIWVDVGVTALFTYLLYGTYSGMMAGLVAGLAFSIVLWVTKQFTGYDRPHLTLKPFRFSWEHVKH